MDFGYDKPQRFVKMQKRHWEELGVQWRLNQEGNTEFFHFHSFGRRVGRDWEGDSVAGPTKGNGRKALAEVCKMADRRKMPLILWTNVAKLVAYYKSFGFVEAHDADSGPGMWTFIRGGSLWVA